jgi:hypothetical protein
MKSKPDDFLIQKEPAAPLTPDAVLEPFMAEDGIWYTKKYGSEEKIPLLATSNTQVIKCDNRSSGMYTTENVFKNPDFLYTVRSNKTGQYQSVFPIVPIVEGEPDNESIMWDLSHISTENTDSYSVTIYASQKV